MPNLSEQVKPQEFSRSFWVVLQAWLQNSSFKALHYNALVKTIFDASFEATGKRETRLQYALSHSPMRELPKPVLRVLKEVLEKALSDGTLTGTRVMIAQMVLQKLSRED